MAGAAPPLSLPARLHLHLGAAALAVLALVQAPGRIAGDTKADLVLDPAHFLARALQAWNGAQGFGQLGNQTYGYLFPMGPFFLAGHAVGLPGWWTQRAWWVLLLLAGYYGTHRLAGLLGVGTPGSRVAGALAYAAAPRVLTVLGGISVEAWPGALVPWALVPLVLAEQGRLGPRRAAALSGAAALAMGAVNAAATAAALAVPAAYLLAGAARPGGRRLLAWWAGATLLASAWWLGPLLILGRYGFPFLDYIENARITTSTTGVLDTLRGAEHWGGYLLTGGSPRWPAGFTLSFQPFAVLCTCLVAAAGLAGLVGPGLPHARRWRACAAAGLLLVCAGHAGTFGGAAAGRVDTLLDGALAALRNVHKFDPLLRLPLALGVAVALGRLLAADRTPVTLAVRRLPSLRRLPAPPSVAVAVVLLGLAGALLPALQPGVTPPGSYRGVPAYWTRVADYLHRHAGSGSALLVPSSNFAVYRWGSPQDEPLQALARSAWAVRDAVPLGAPGSYRILDAIDPVLAEGRPGTSVAPALARLGVGYVVLRNDLAAAAAGAEQPAVVRAALAGSPGLRRVAAFGHHDAVEVFAVAGAQPPLVTEPAASAVALSGGPEATVGSAGGLAGRAALLLGDTGGRPVGGVVVTDTGRRRSLAFGYAAAVPAVDADGRPTGIGDDLARYSPTLPATADPRGDRPAAQFGPVLARDRQTVSALAGVRAVTASTSAADPFGPLYRGVADRPESALDGDRATRWISAAASPVGQWLDVDLAAPVTAPAVDVRFVDDRDVGPRVTRVALRTDTGTAQATVRKGTEWQRLTLPPGATRTLRITVTAVHGRPAGEVGIADLALPGLFPQAQLTTATSFPPGTRGRPTAVRLDRSAGDRAACVLTSPAAQCATTLAHQGEEVVPATRVVRTPGPVGGSLAVSVHAADGGAQVTALAARGVAVRASASSAAVPAVAGSALAAVDGDPATAWTPKPADRTPRLRLTFPADPAGRPVTIRGTFPAGTRLRVSTDAGRVTLTARHGRVAPVRLAGRAWTVTVVRRHRGDVVRVADVRVAGTVTTPETTPAPVDVGCAAGPALEVDGVTIRLAVHATVRQLMSGAVLAAHPCTAFAGLPAGVHRIRFLDTGSLVVDGASLGFAQLPTAAPRAGTLTAHGDSRYRATVAPGAAAYVVLTTSYDAGWRATADGRPLAAVRLDGWRQGFLLPADTSATHVVVTFGPATAQRAALGAGVVAVLLLVLLGVLPSRPVRRRTDSRRGPAPFLAWPLRVVAVLLGLLVAGPLGAVLAAAALAVPAGRRAAGAAGAMVLAGVLAVLAPGAWPASACAVAAAAALLAAALDPLSPPAPD